MPHGKELYIVYVEQLHTGFVFPYVRWVPVFADKEQRLGVMSISFLLQEQDDAIVWRGPKKNGKALRLSFPQQVSICLSCVYAKTGSCY